MAIADFDELNISWIGKMEISPQEKYLRLEIITDFKKRFSKIFEKQKKVADSDCKDKSYLLSLLTVPMAIEWRNIYDKYYEKYVGLLTNSRFSGYPGAQTWYKQHSKDFAEWVQNTTLSGIESGDKIDEVFSEDRLTNIARTEANGIADSATLDAFYREGYTHKKWTSFKDNRVRKTHKEADGQIVPLNQPFRVGDSLLMFPHDTSLGASADEIIGCRCVMQPINRRSKT